MEYTIVSSDSSQETTQIVTELLNNGWLPIGGVSVSMFYDIDACYSYYIFAQAMVRNEETAKRYNMPDTRQKS